MDLVHRTEQRSVHALATPLITKVDGTKFGKTESGTVWLDPDLSSPYAFYRFWINADDRDTVGYLKVFTDLPREDIADRPGADGRPAHDRRPAGSQRLGRQQGRCASHGP